MTVYLVQKRYWHFNDDYYLLDDCYPVKAFESQEDAEQFCQQKSKETNGYGGENTWMLTEDGGLEPDEVAMYEVVEAEITV